MSVHILKSFERKFYLFVLGGINFYNNLDRIGFISEAVYLGIEHV